MRTWIWIGALMMVGCVELGARSGVTEGGGPDLPEPVTQIIAGGPELGARCRGSAWDLPMGGDVCEMPRSCQFNRPPVLGKPWFLVEGRLQRTLLERELVSNGVFLVVPYTDPDCNLGCGRFEQRGNDPFGDGGEFGALSGALGCGTEDRDHCLTMWLYFDKESPDTYPFEFQVEDACGDLSNTILGSITIPERP